MVERVKMDGAVVPHVFRSKLFILDLGGFITKLLRSGLLVDYRLFMKFHSIRFSSETGGNRSSKAEVRPAV